MKVRATQLGYYGDRRRRVGEVFILKPFKRIGKDKKVMQITPEMQLSEHWMEKVSENESLKVGKKVTRSLAYPPEMPSVAKAAHEPGPDEEEEEFTGDKNVI